MLRLGRVITAAVTPFTDDGSAIALERWERLLAHLRASGSDGILIGGTTGEGPTLEEDEFLALIRRARAVCGADYPLMANVGTNHTKQSIARAKSAQDAGASSLLVVCPYYNKPPQHGLIAHFAAIAAATPLPVMIYNIPGRTSVNMLPETVAELARRCPTIVGIKEASGDLAQMRQVIERVGAVGRADFNLWSGDDALLAEVMALGGVGVVSVLSQVAGPQIQAIVQAALAGDLEGARAQQTALNPLIEAAFCTTNPIPIKTMLNALGIAVGPCRLPLVEPLPEQREKILVVVEQLKEVMARTA